MPYNLNKRDRVEGYPKTGTKDRLKKRAKKGKKTFGALVIEILRTSRHRMKFGTDKVLGKDIPVKGGKPAPILTLGKSVPVLAWAYPPKPARLRTSTSRGDDRTAQR
ncbi:MAG: hypothetical protein IPG92_15525 [Flavobacteriales bacterium]|nr:hypothetical protein [Flavobacteriales bacterium]